MEMKLVGLEQELEEMAQELERVARDALRAGCELAAEEARGSHDFNNRTGDLEDSIQVIEPTGSLVAGTLESGIEATMEYAEFVEKSHPFLAPALEKTEGERDAIMELALNGTVV